MRRITFFSIEFPSLLTPRVRMRGHQQCDRLLPHSSFPPSVFSFLRNGKFDMQAAARHTQPVNGDAQVVILHTQSAYQDLSERKSRSKKAESQ